jgi:ELWxxDGT repeat protein
LGGIRSSLVGAGLTRVGNVVYFNGNGELWKTDGTVAGTTKVADGFSGFFGPANFTDVNGNVFFSAQTADQGWELWMSNGAAADTVMVKDIAAGPSSSFPSYLTNISGTLYFQANDGATGYELWQSDGTATGTVLVNDIFPGAIFSGNPRSMTKLNGKLLVVATTEHGQVDGADFLAWQRSLGSPASAPGRDADGNLSGAIDEDDLNIWKINFGSSAAAPAALSAFTTTSPDQLAIQDALYAAGDFTELFTRAKTTGRRPRVRGIWLMT